MTHIGVTSFVCVATIDDLYDLFLEGGGLKNYVIYLVHSIMDIKEKN